MKRGMPSLAALLGLLAIAGYQNRDKIAEMLGKVSQGGQTGDGGILGKLGGLIGGASSGEMLRGGLGDLLDSFRKTGQGDTADSWVKTGPNQPVATSDLERALGPELLDTLTRQTGLSRQELLDRLTQSLPEAVDTLTPEGRLPTQEEADRATSAPA
jgi:uncharacterized protein YidB (DUF937 family)